MAMPSHQKPRRREEWEGEDAWYGDDLIDGDSLILGESGGGSRTGDGNYYYEADGDRGDVELRILGLGLRLGLRLG